MNTEVILGLVGAASFISLGLSVLGAWKFSRLKRRMDELSQKTGNLMEIEETVMAKNTNYEDFERTISNLSEKLFALVKKEYGIEATTYEEMIEELEELESDEKIVDDLEKFFKYIEQLEYSDRELTEKDKALVRQAAFRLLRRSGTSLEEVQDHKITG